MKNALVLPAAALALLIGSALAVPSANAGYVVDLTQVGSDVVASGSGAIDLTDLSLLATEFILTGIAPSSGLIQTGPAIGGLEDVYSGITGPTSFGSGSGALASVGNGDIVGAGGSSALLGVPAGYVSGSALSSTMTFDNATFASLGVTPGTYEWTWGSRAHADSFTLGIVAPTTIPEPSTWAMMALGFGLLGIAGVRRSRKGGVSALS